MMNAVDYFPDYSTTPFRLYIRRTIQSHVRWDDRQRWRVDKVSVETIMFRFVPAWRDWENHERVRTADIQTPNLHNIGLTVDIYR
jgi:hypothetical protein